MAEYNCFFPLFFARDKCIYLKISVLLGKKLTSASIRTSLSIKSLTQTNCVLLFELPSAKIYIVGIVQCKLRKERTKKCPYRIPKGMNGHFTKCTHSILLFRVTFLF